MEVVDSSDWSLRDYPNNSDFASMDVPNMVGPVQYLNPRMKIVLNGTGSAVQWLSPNAFVGACPTNNNAAGCVPKGPSEMPRGMCCTDLESTIGTSKLSKDTNFTESTRMELRIEFYNVMNHENFWPGGISDNIQAPNFGQMTSDSPSTGQGPRLIQLAAKFYF